MTDYSFNETFSLSLSAVNVKKAVFKFVYKTHQQRNTEEKSKDYKRRKLTFKD